MTTTLLYPRALAEGLQDHGLLPARIPVPDTVLEQVFGDRAFPVVFDAGLLLVSLLGLDDGLEQGFFALPDEAIQRAPGCLRAALGAVGPEVTCALEGSTLQLLREGRLVAEGRLSGTSPSEALWHALEQLDIALMEGGDPLSITALHMPAGLSAAVVGPRAVMQAAREAGCAGLGGPGDYGLFEADAGGPWDPELARDPVRTEVALQRSLGLVLAAERAQADADEPFQRQARRGLLSGLADLHGAWALRRVLELPGQGAERIQGFERWRGQPLDPDETRAVQTAAVLLHQAWRAVLADGET